MTDNFTLDLADEAATIAFGAVLAKAGAKVTSFVRLEVGEGIAKVEVDFAAEVAATQAAAAGK